MNWKHFFSKEHKYVQPPLRFDFNSNEDFSLIRIGREIEYNKNKNFWNIYEDVSWDIIHFSLFNIKYPLKTFLKGINNFWKYRKVIYKDRWYDYKFLTVWLQIKLQDMYDNWDKSYYVGSEKEKETLERLLGYLEVMSNYEFDDIEADIAQEEFFKLLSKNYQKFWD
jgi:hypothetical protein